MPSNISGLKRLIFVNALVYHADTKKIDGIPVMFDNAYYENTDLDKAWLNTGTENSDYFIAGPFDTGREDAKSLTFTVYPVWPENKSFVMRTFNKIVMGSSAIAIQAMSYSGGPRTASIAGRFVIPTIYKPVAKDSFMYYTVDGVKHYLYKGENVTE